MLPHWSAPPIWSSQSGLAEEVLEVVAWMSM
jgi:hypothetical protein